MFATRNGTPSSRTPSPPTITRSSSCARRPVQPAPEKRRPCVRARSQTSLNRSPNSAQVTGTGSRRLRSPAESGEATSPISVEDLAARSYRSQLALLASRENSGDAREATSLSKSQSSPCLVTAGMHDRHSHGEEKLIASRSILSDAFSAFNRCNTSVPKTSTPHPVLLGSLLGPSGDKQQLCTSEPHHPAMNGKGGRGVDKRSDTREASVPRDNHKVEAEQRLRKALDAKLLRDMAALGM